MARSAMQAGSNIVLRRTFEVLPRHVGDLHLRRLTCISTGTLGVDALRDLDRQGDVRHVEVAEGDVANITATTSASVAIHAGGNIESLPGLDVSSVSGVDDPNVFEQDVFVL